MTAALRKFTSPQAILDEAWGRSPPQAALGADTERVELYHYHDSICSQKVRLALAEKNVPYASHIVSLITHDNLKPDYVRINPRAVVPTLVVDGQPIIDSATIVRYVAVHFPGPSLIPADAAAAGLMTEWVERGDLLPIREVTYREMSAMAGPAGEIMRHSLAARRALIEGYMAEAPELADAYTAKLVDVDDWEPAMGDPQRIADEMVVIEQAMNELEALLSVAPWIAGDAFTLADIVWIPVIARLKLVRLDAKLWQAGRRPAVAAYWERLKARPSFDAAIKRFNTNAAAA
jgi:glutathione S-transferase